MSVITRAILNPNLTIESFTTHDDGSTQHTVKTYSDIIYDINCAKTYLVNERNVQAGQKVLLCENDWPHFLTWFIACAELGLGFVFLDKINKNNSESLVNKMDAYGVDHVIIWPYSTFAKNIGKYNIDPIHVGIYGFYISPLTRPDAHADVMLATSNTTLFYKLTDGVPKLIKHSHQYVYDLLERNAKLYNLTESDSCLHSVGFADNSSPATYILPVLKYCATHYYINPTNSNLANLVKLKNITHSMESAFKLDGQDIFETAETLGPVLLDNKCLDNFFGVYLETNNFLAIKLPDTKIVVTNSVFSQINSIFTLVNTPNIVRLNGTEINTTALSATVAEFLKAVPGTDFDLFLTLGHRIYIITQSPINLSLLNSYIITKLLLTEYNINQRFEVAQSNWIKIS
jgi:hypothetical protein